MPPLRHCRWSGAVCHIIHSQCVRCNIGPSSKLLATCVCYGLRTRLKLVYCGLETDWCSKLIGAGAFQEVRLSIPHVIETLVTVIACYKHMGATKNYKWHLFFTPCACCLYIYHNLHVLGYLLYYNDDYYSCCYCDYCLFCFCIV